MIELAAQEVIDPLRMKIYFASSPFFLFFEPLTLSTGGRF
jgi:hypothetical protein